MTFGAVVVARMDSSRLPGKALRASLGRPTLEIIVERLLRADFERSEIVVATTAREVDEPIRAFAARRDIAAFPGPLDDVAARVVDSAHSMGWSAFARVNGDSPFVAADLIREGLQQVASGETDFVTNLVPRTYPYGVAVEAVDVGVYDDSLAHAQPGDREHVTKHLYRSLPPKTTRLTCPLGDLSAIRMTIDTASDEERLANLLQTVGADAISVDALQFANHIRDQLP